MTRLPPATQVRRPLSRAVSVHRILVISVSFESCIGKASPCLVFFSSSITSYSSTSIESHKPNNTNILTSPINLHIPLQHCNTAGHFCDTAGSIGAANKCQEVPLGFYSAAGTGASVSCGVGYTTISTGTGGDDAQSACICTAGYGRSSTASACVACTAPSFKIASGDAICSSCAIGQFYDTDNTYVGTTDQCETCGAGYTNTATGQSGADAQAGCICDSGYERGTTGDTSTACQLCAFGDFKASASNADCGACAGTEQSSDDRISCISKPSGQPTSQPTSPTGRPTKWAAI